jgi:hypothetical protein
MLGEIMKKFARHYCLISMPCKQRSRDQHSVLQLVLTFDTCCSCHHPVYDTLAPVLTSSTPTCRHRRLRQTAR